MPRTSGGERPTSPHDPHLLGAVSKAHLDAVCRTASALFGAPIALVIAVGKAGERLDGRSGPPIDPARVHKVFGRYLMRGEASDLLVVPDVVRDPRFAASALVRREGRVRFFAGIALSDGAGADSGLLCVLDTSPRDDFDEDQARRLRDLALTVEAHLRLHALHDVRSRAAARLAGRDATLRALSGTQRMAELAANFGSWRIDPHAWSVTWSEGIARIFGRPMPEDATLDLDTHIDFYHPDDRLGVRDRIERAIAASSPATGYQGRARIVRPDGAIRHVVIQGMPEAADDGGVSAIHGVVMDVTDYVVSEQYGREASQLLRTTIETMDQGLISYGPDLRVRVHNRRANEILDLPHDVLRDHARMQDVHEFLAARGEFEGEPDHMARLAATGDINAAPTVFERVRPDGTIIEIRGAALPSGGFVHTFADVTQRRASELSVQESETRYRLLADAASDMIVRRTIDNVRTYVSPACHELLGFTPEEFLRIPIGETLHPDDYRRTIDFLEALQAGRIDHDRITHRLRHRDGRWIWVDARTRLLRDRTGKPSEVITAARDISERMAAEEALKASEARYRALADSLPQLVWIMSVEDGNATYVNRRFEDYCGRLGPERSARLALIHPDEAGRIAVLWDDVMASGTACGAEARVRRHDGIYRWHKFVCLPIREMGAVVGVLGTALEIDEMVVARAELQHTTDLLKLAQEAAGAGLWEWDVRTGAIRHSPESARMFHFAEDFIRSAGASVPIEQDEWAARVHPDELPRIWEAVRSAIERRSIYRCEFRLVAVDGVERWIQAVAHVAYDETTGEALRFVGLHFDVTEQKAAEKRVAHLAQHDELTGLPNRRLLHETLDREIAAARGREGYTAILLCDLDRFKAVNDTFGHTAGDRLLRALARRLQSVLREDDMVARLGGDEFAIVLARRTEPGDAGAVAERVIEAVGQPFDLVVSEASVGVSIGVALACGEGLGADDLFRQADIALYRAKAAGRNTFRTYEPAMDAAAVARHQLEIDMRQAVQGGGFSLHYQPVVSVSTGESCGFEALMRWRHPTRGWVAPTDFIPLAEETGAIIALGTWALQEACREAAAWPNGLRVAVNISAVQFARPGLELSVAAALSASGLAPRRLELEITESVLMSDAEAVIACLHRLRALGVRIALDDFGTGYSSLSYLRRFPFDKIKIDRSFVADIDNPDTAAIVRAVVGLGERLGAGITAEGVETPEQFERVRREGCTEAQGYLFSKPLPADEALRFDRVRNGQAA